MPKRKATARPSVRKAGQKKQTKKDAAGQNLSKSFQHEVDDLLKRSKYNMEERVREIKLAGDKIAACIPEKWTNVTVEDFIKFGGDYPITSIIQLASTDMDEVVVESVGRLEKDLKNSA